MCYFTGWARYRPAPASFGIDDVDPNLCTHLIYAFAGLDAATNRIKPLDPFTDLTDNFGMGTVDIYILGNFKGCHKYYS